MNKICANCNSIFITKREEAKFCSRSCSDKGRREKIMVECINCKTVFRDIDNKKNKKRKFCSLICSRNYAKGENSKTWKGGRVVTGQGYIMIRISSRYILEHRFIMENFISRKLRSNEIVHHKNGDRKDNNINNLILMTRSNHNREHIKLRKQKFGDNGMPKRWKK